LVDQMVSSRSFQLGELGSVVELGGTDDLVHP
jgi:hypothetical protein